MQATSTQEITLADSGIASAYIVLPLGKFSREVARLRTAIQHHAAARAKEKKPSNINLNEVIYAFGHADLLARFEIHDLRAMLRFSYPKDSDAHVLNFILSVPSHIEGNLDDPAKSMRFTMHLRLRRSMYAEDDAVSNELGVIGYLCKRLQDAQCAATIHVALGWADLIVDGVFDPTNMGTFANFLVEVHEGYVLDASGGRHAVFQRTMTILGLRFPDDPLNFHPPALPDATPAVFVRGEPGYLQDAIERFSSDERIDIRLIDGKSDFVAIAKEPISDFLTNNVALSLALRDHRIQKLETHLVFSEPQRPDAERPERTIVGRTTNSLPGRCHCFNPAMEPVVSPNLPESLKQSIANLLFLCHSTLHDQMSCCDVFQAVLSAKRALTRLSRRVDELHAERQKLDREYLSEELMDPEKAGHIHQQCRMNQGKIEAKLHELDVWHLLAERVLRQRTVATFDALLLQSDRSIVYRGSVQKFLFLADALMNDFAVRISKWKGVTPQFCAMGDSVPRILSLKGMGLVRIPPHHVFTLPFVIPDLWHEVGVYWFYKYADVEKFKLGDRDLSDPELGELGDLYGDLVVVRHGFAGDFLRFLFSLTRGWLDYYDREKLSPSVYAENYEDLLTRLVFAQVVADPKPISDSELDSIDRFISDARGIYAKHVIKASHKTIREYFPEVHELNPRLARITGIVVTKLKLYARTLQEVFNETISADVPSRSDRKSYADMVEGSNGRLLRFNDGHDMNALMGELYWQFQRHRIARITALKTGKSIPAPFQRMASVAKSAIIEYHRRHARRP